MSLMKFENDIIVFEVKASKDLRIVLTSDENEEQPVIEVIIGGFENTKSIIRHNQVDVVEIDTPGILSADVFLDFWIRASDNVITVGMGNADDLREKTAIELMTWKYPETFEIKYYNISGPDSTVNIFPKSKAQNDLPIEQNDTKSEIQNDLAIDMPAEQNKTNNEVKNDLPIGMLPERNDTNSEVQNDLAIRILSERNETKKEVQNDLPIDMLEEQNNTKSEVQNDLAIDMLGEQNETKSEAKNDRSIDMLPERNDVSSEAQNDLPTDMLPEQNASTEKIHTVDSKKKIPQQDTDQSGNREEHAMLIEPSIKEFASKVKKHAMSIASSIKKSAPKDREHGMSIDDPEEKFVLIAEEQSQTEGERTELEESDSNIFCTCKFFNILSFSIKQVEHTYQR